MTTTADLLTTINPLPDEAAARLPIESAEREMLEALLATPEVLVPPPPPRRAPAWRRPALAVLGAAAVAIPVLAVLAVLPVGRDAATHPSPPATHPAPQTATTTPAVTRLADASPRVLLQQPGWRVWRADEMSRLWGELDLKRAGSSTGGGLSWFPASDTRGYIQDRSTEASIKTTVPLLGTTAHVYQAKGPRVHGTYGFTAIWRMGARGLMFEGGARNMSAFRDLLGHLHVVDYATWLRAMPASVVMTSARSETIRTMLTGVPLPPGFNVSQIPGATLIRDRYQLGAAVTGTVACEWFARWGHARRTGDHAAVRQADAALATARRWPVLKQMSRSGDWPSVLIGYAKATRTGHWFGRPLLGDVNSGLGCSRQWHVKLGSA